MSDPQTEADQHNIACMSQHISHAAIIARLCLPLSKEDFLDLCGAAFDVVTVKADEFRKEFGDGKK